MTRKVLSTIVVLALLVAGAWMAVSLGNLTSEQCVRVASESICRISSRAVIGLSGFFVAYFGMKKLRDIWPANAAARDGRAD